MCAFINLIISKCFKLCEKFLGSREEMNKTRFLLGEGNGTPLQYFGHLMQRGRVDLFEKTLMLGDIRGRRRRGRQRMRWHHRLDGREFE